VAAPYFTDYLLIRYLEVEVNNENNIGMIKLRTECCSFVIWFWIWLYSLCNVDICYTVL